VTQHEPKNNIKHVYEKYVHVVYLHSCDKIIRFLVKLVSDL